MIQLIASQNIPLVWPKVSEAVEQTIRDYGEELSLQVIYAELTQGFNQLWLYLHGMDIKAWTITSISTYPSGLKRLRLVLARGKDRDEWLQHVDVIEQWALQFGCVEAEAWVRPGLRKELRRMGYERAYEVVVKPLEKRMNS